MRWTICAMLFAATTINYMDRSIIGFVKPTLMKSVALGGIGMTDRGYGYVTAAFMVAYALGLLGAGRFVDKVGTRIGYMIIMAAWSLSAMSHALANSMLQFGIARAGLGLGESGNFPAANKTNAEWFPQKDRSFSFGIFNSGANMGAILTPAIMPWVIINFGWHYAFLFTGLFSMTWIVLWYFTYRKPAEHPRVTQAELAYINQGTTEKEETSTPWANLWGIRQTWAFTITKFLTDPVWWFYLLWLPSYFSKNYQLDIQHLGLPLIVVYSASTIGSVGGGYLPAPFIRMGLAAERARIATMLLCAFLVVPVFLINYTSSEWIAVGLLSLAAAAHQGFSANLFSTASDMFPRSAVGSVTGIGGMAGAVGGALMMVYAGDIVQLTGSYTSLFEFCACIYLISMFIMSLIAPGLKRVDLTA
ncbi:MAG TPA: MFS transporter [Terracidiphilus sp.]|nr:MFS transporter [Terracidiphilus sp.]